MRFRERDFDYWTGIARILSSRYFRNICTSHTIYLFIIQIIVSARTRESQEATLIYFLLTQCEK